MLSDDNKTISDVNYSSGFMKLLFKHFEWYAKEHNYSVIKLSDSDKNELKELKKLEVGADKYKTAVDGVAKLADRIIEIEKFEAEKEELAKNQKNNENEASLKIKQLANERQDRLIRNCIEGGKVVLGLGFAAWAFVASMNFEKEGTVTTLIGRGFINKLLHKN